MDWALLTVYALAGLLSLCFFAIVLILLWSVFLISKKVPDWSKDYLKNIIYAIFGGIIAVILLEMRGLDWKQWAFWAINLPLNLVAILIFILCGFLYLYLLNVMFKYIEKKKESITNTKPETKAIITNKISSRAKKQDLEGFFDKHKNTLLVLSIFLLVTLTLVFEKGYLNNVLAILASLITYFMLIGINRKDSDNDTIWLSGFKIVFSIFVSAFCAWIILNVVIGLEGEREKVFWILAWLVLMIVPSFQWFKKKVD